MDRANGSCLAGSFGESVYVSPAPVSPCALRVGKDLSCELIGVMDLFCMDCCNSYRPVWIV
jgi:hypothetical protein